MKTAAISLNLSRKWRSQNFDQIVGQDLAVRILKNSLYLGHYFPVYLFAGQRGCGKTSTARVFAAALNCEQLPSFQQDPKKVLVPCLLCNSCCAMQNGKHPDFIEIDAASHTGVDHMRTIIESSSLLPIMGCKRVYLIDEAHMLSKAAFNAALKILEEPPTSALFILATTNPHKIIDTVRSRCFQLFFSPIEHDSLKKHLQTICKKESIVYDDEALDLIVRQTQGSARDALNVLEQVRFSSPSVNKTSVLKLLGHLDDYFMLDIIRVTLTSSVVDLLSTLKRVGIEQYAADFVWQRLMMILRMLVWVKHGVVPTRSDVSQDALMEMAKTCSLSDIYQMIEELYYHEELFLKTPMQHVLLEMILLHVCQRDKKKPRNNSDGGSAPCSLNSAGTELITEEENEGTPDDMLDTQCTQTKPLGDVDYQHMWLQCVEQIVCLNDPLLNSLFKRARFVAYDEHAKKVVVEMAKDLVLFKEWLEKASHLWKPIVKKLFSSDSELQAQFTGAQVGTIKTQKHTERTYHKDSVEKIMPATVPVFTRDQSFNPQKQQYKKRMMSSDKNEVMCDVSDQNKWKIASMLLRHFPGVVTEIRENR